MTLELVSDELNHLKIKPWHKHAKWPPSYLTPWILTLYDPQKLQFNWFLRTLI